MSNHRGVTMHGYRQATDEDLGAVYHEWRIADREDIHNADQDHYDGAALRRLREALPGHHIGVTVDRALYGDNVVVEADLEGQGYVTLGATIAEAADACREALEK